MEDNFDYTICPFCHYTASHSLHNGSNVRLVCDNCHAEWVLGLGVAKSPTYPYAVRHAGTILNDNLEQSITDEFNKLVK